MRLLTFLLLSHLIFVTACARSHKSDEVRDSSMPDLDSSMPDVFEVAERCAGDPAGAEPAGRPEISRVCVEVIAPFNYTVELAGVRLGCSRPEAWCESTVTGAEVFLDGCGRTCGAGRDPYEARIQCDTSLGLSAIQEITLTGFPLRDLPTADEGIVCYRVDGSAWVRERAR